MSDARSKSTGTAPRGCKGSDADVPGTDGAGALEFGMLPELVGRQLRIAHLLAFKDFSPETGGKSLSAGSFEILELLAHNPGLTQSRLAAAIGLEKSSFVPAIVRLEDLGLVERRPSASDKRANDLRITAGGRDVLEELRRYVKLRDRRITEGMSAREVEMLNRLLKKVASING